AAFRTEREWAHIASPAWTPSTLDDTLADLDVFGPRSLGALFPVTSAALGRPRLRLWLSSHAAIDEIARRHDSVRGPVPESAFRDEMLMYGKRATASPERVARFVGWASTPATPTPGWLVAASFLVPALTAGFIALQAAGATATPFWLGTLTLAAAI